MLFNQRRTLRQPKYVRRTKPRELATTLLRRTSASIIIDAIHVNGPYGFDSLEEDSVIDVKDYQVPVLVSIPGLGCVDFCFESDVLILIVKDESEEH